MGVCGGVQRQEEEGQMMCCKEGTVGRGLNRVRSKNQADVCIFKSKKKIFLNAKVKKDNYNPQDLHGIL